MRFSNSTDIPDQLVAIAVAHSLAEGVVIDEIVIRNKAYGKLAGKYGHYDPRYKQISINVPREVPHGFKNKMAYSKCWQTLNSRAEFLVAVIAHELRHAWQHQSDGETFKGMSQYTCAYRELDAESFENRMLAKWREQHAFPLAARKV